MRILSLPAVTPVDLLIEQHTAIPRAVLGRDPAEAEQAIRPMSEVPRIANDLASRDPDLIEVDV